MRHSKYTKPEISKMEKTFLQTMSCAVTAKICGCNVKTIARYRDQEGWITKQQVKELCKGGRETTLTTEIAIKLANGWRLHIGDKDLCSLVGITYGQLRGWLQENTQVTIVRSVRCMSHNGVPLKDEQGNDSISRIIETVGLYDLRARERASLEYNYMQKLDILAERAEAAGDFRTAFKIIAWILSKRLPKKFGNNPIEVNVNTENRPTFIEIDSLDLPLETRKLILEKIRQQETIIDSK